ncbi:MAG: hypothetical protein PVG78_07025 [Desulfobacterales bacterium]|jgi:hypothetical protein
MDRKDGKRAAQPAALTHRRNLGVILVLALLAAGVLGGCYPKRIGPPGADGKPLTWAEMNTEQRKAHMAAVVIPRAGAVFRAWRPERFARIDCTLCHGQGAVNGNFSMPTAHLPRLSGDLLLGPERAKYPDTTQLKLDRLVPEMADALGLKKFSLVTRRGFGCYSCHLGPEGPLFGN